MAQARHFHHKSSISLPLIAWIRLSIFAPCGVDTHLSHLLSLAIPLSISSGAAGTTGCALLLRVIVRVVLRLLPEWGDGGAPHLAVGAIHEFVRAGELCFGTAQGGMADAR